MAYKDIINRVNMTEDERNARSQGVNTDVVQEETTETTQPFSGTNPAYGDTLVEPKTEEQIQQEKLEAERNETKDYLIGQGFNENQVNNYMNPEPNKPLYEQIYSDTTTAPNKPSEKAIRNARTAASLGDTFGVLADTFGASRGARVKPRDFSKSATAKQAAEEKYVRNLYDQKKTNYDRGKMSAMFADAKEKAMTGREDRARIDKSIQTKKATEAQKAKDIREQKRIEAEQAQRDKIHKFNVGKEKTASTLSRDKFNETVRSNKAKEAVDKADKYQKTEKGKIYMNIPTTADDPNAVKDMFGKPIIKREVTESDIEALANRAKGDMDFRREYAEIAFVDRAGRKRDEVIRGFTNNEDLAWMYAEYLQKKERSLANNPTPVQPTVQSNTQSNSLIDDPAGIL